MRQLREQEGTATTEVERLQATIEIQKRDLADKQNALNDVEAERDWRKADGSRLQSNIETMKLTHRDLLRMVILQTMDPTPQKEWHAAHVTSFGDFMDVTLVERSDHKPTTFKDSTSTLADHLEGLMGSRPEQYSFGTVVKDSLDISQSFNHSAISAEMLPAFVHRLDYATKTILLPNIPATYVQIMSTCLNSIVMIRLKEACGHGLHYAWLAGIAVQLMCSYRHSVKGLLPLRSDLSLLPILEAIGEARLKLAVRYFMNKRGLEEYEDKPLTPAIKSENEELPVDDSAAQLARADDLSTTAIQGPIFKQDFDEECFAFTMPLFIQSICKTHDLGNEWLIVREHYVGVYTGAELYSWLHDRQTSEWTLTTDWPTAVKYEKMHLTVEWTGDCEHTEVLHRDDSMVAMLCKNSAFEKESWRVRGIM